MTMLLGNDLVINENDCNLSCQYCLTGQSNLKQSHREQLIFKPPRRDRYGAATPLGKRVDAIIDRIALGCEAPLLKITGGEVFLIDNIMELVEAAARRFPSVVLQTNGVLISADHIRRLAGHSNITLQISLDSHRFEGNSFRVPRRDLHDKILARIATLLESKIPMEIYAVLNERSADHLPDFVNWLDEFDTDLQFFAFPVRGPDSNRYAMRLDQIQHIEAVVRQYDRYQRILPPMAYFVRLLRFLKEGGRNFRCHLPRLVISSFSDGTLTACPNIWFSDLGNIVDDDWQSTLSTIGHTPLYHALTGPRIRLDACKRCFTPWDILSMYFDDEISLAELCRGPVYRAAAVRAYLERAKAAYDRERVAETSP
jgi:MoaA/NifB/PqqE/SkfB family radical SAM enzyme